ncbi:hypothetical protein HNY73_023240 [Argiope bruennichi]|uniref:Uncharacterized protein n=1 Tax=Argiope bruennichi TaxID=94029 RepID=A0A8T0E4S1_ARGBR|nr:hypothetical protein HNY73_023240 [Argiope bruennichi]
MRFLASSLPMPSHILQHPSHPLQLRISIQSQASCRGIPSSGPSVAEVPARVLTDSGCQKLLHQHHHIHLRGSQPPPVRKQRCSQQVPIHSPQRILCFLAASKRFLQCPYPRPIPLSSRQPSLASTFDNALSVRSIRSRSLQLRNQHSRQGQAAARHLVERPYSESQPEVLPDQVLRSSFLTPPPHPTSGKSKPQPVRQGSARASKGPSSPQAILCFPCSIKRFLSAFSSANSLSALAKRLSIRLQRKDTIGIGQCSSSVMPYSSLFSAVGRGASSARTANAVSNLQ